MNNQREITIYGRLGKKPELRLTKKEKPFCCFTLAEQVDGEEAPRWHNVVMWEKEAEHWSNVLNKGTTVFVRGRIVDRECKNDMGELKQYKEINADAIGFTS
jgi:single stranded DNA-binding protein